MKFKKKSNINMFIFTNIPYKHLYNINKNNVFGVNKRKRKYIYYITGFHLSLTMFSCVRIIRQMFNMT